MQDESRVVVVLQPTGSAVGNFATFISVFAIYVRFMIGFVGMQGTMEPSVLAPMLVAFFSVVASWWFQQQQRHLQWYSMIAMEFILNDDDDYVMEPPYEMDLPTPPCIITENSALLAALASANGVKRDMPSRQAYSCRRTLSDTDEDEEGEGEGEAGCQMRSIPCRRPLSDADEGEEEDEGEGEGETGGQTRAIPCRRNLSDTDEGEDGEGEGEMLHMRADSCCRALWDTEESGGDEHGGEEERHTEGVEVAMSSEEEGADCETDGTESPAPDSEERGKLQIHKFAFVSSLVYTHSACY
jgi:hypothetical protein